MLAEVTFSIDPVTVLARVLHTTCAATMLGGLIYLRFVLAPAATGPDGENVLFAGRSKAWAMCVGICTGLLLLSGTYNFVMTILQNEKLPPLYHMLFGIKFLLAFVVFTIAALTAGKTGAAQRVRQKLGLWLNVAIVCALAIFLLGAVLRSIPRASTNIPLPDGVESPVEEATLLRPARAPLWACPAVRSGYQAQHCGASPQWRPHPFSKPSV